MSPSGPTKSSLSEADLDFVVDHAAPGARDRATLKRLIVEDDAFRKGMLTDEKLLSRAAKDDEILLRISPALYFEILLRNALKEMERSTYTFERTGAQRIAVFDAGDVVQLMSRTPTLDYLVDMLGSFTRIRSYVIPVRVRKGVWRRIRFNDMDVDSLQRMCETVDEESRFALYKRIADVCLFILGVFPEFAQFDYRYPHTGEPRPKVALAGRRGMQEYEEEGRRFYRLAGEHPSARALEMSEVLWLLHENFNVAKKPLNFVSEHYLHRGKRRLFGVEN